MCTCYNLMCVFESKPLTELPRGSLYMFCHSASASGIGLFFASETAVSTSFFTACRRHGHCQTSILNVLRSVILNGINVASIIETWASFWLMSDACKSTCGTEASLAKLWQAGDTNIKPITNGPFLSSSVLLDQRRPFLAKAS